MKHASCRTAYAMIERGYLRICGYLPVVYGDFAGRAGTLRNAHRVMWRDASRVVARSHRVQTADDSRGPDLANGLRE
jgi:hypothetical protein